MTGSLQIKNEKYYAVLNFKDSTGKRVQKWINLNLPIKGNKRRAEAVLNELLVNYQGYESIEPMNLLLSQHIFLFLGTASLTGTQLVTASFPTCIVHLR